MGIILVVMFQRLLVCIYPFCQTYHSSDGIYIIICDQMTAVTRQRGQGIAPTLGHIYTLAWAMNTNIPIRFALMCDEIRRVRSGIYLYMSLFLTASIVTALMHNKDTSTLNLPLLINDNSQDHRIWHYTWREQIGPKTGRHSLLQLQYIWEGQRLTGHRRIKFSRSMSQWTTSL